MKHNSISILNLALVAVGLYLLNSDNINTRIVSENVIHYMANAIIIMNTLQLFAFAWKDDK